jgi:16S rRNA (cytosine1402-N4)-methyltransferase
LGVAGPAQHEHQPVLVSHVLQLLDPAPGQVLLDGTVGLGGHAAALLPRLLPGGRYIGLDLDADMLALARGRLAEFGAGAVELHPASFAEFPEVLAQLGLREVDLMLLDVGVNSAQLDDASRGFSFDREGALDMRFDRSRGQTAADLVNGLSERELSDIFYFNAQEPASRKIARRICQVRHSGRITTTSGLARAVESAVMAAGLWHPGKIHPATRVFQALRIAVNGELDSLRRFVALAADHLRPGGKLAVISFHSLEDGIVKQAIRAGKTAGVWEELTKRPVVADPDERTRNPRSRSAKLRVARRLPGSG